MEFKMKPFKGKAIYQPSGKAREYAEWACNFYVGCSNGCTYCYCKKGILAVAMGGNTPKLKACFKDENHAIDVFEKELNANLPELQKHGLFFSFTTDPMLKETIGLTLKAMKICNNHLVKVNILTKRADWIGSSMDIGRTENGLLITFPYFYGRNSISFGFTLTGHDELEPNASTNAERIEAMRKLHKIGFKTWASIEPVIDFRSSLEMFAQCAAWCDMFKIGLESGKKYKKLELNSFITSVLSAHFAVDSGKKYPKIYFKDSLLKQAGISRSELPNNCVGRDYNIFKNE